MKNAGIEEVVEAVETVYTGGIHYSSTSSASLIKKIAPGKYNIYQKNNSISFSEIELKVIKRNCRQVTTKEIADQLHLSVRSIEEYSRKIKEKTKAKNIAGIVLFALKNNLVGNHEIG